MTFNFISYFQVPFMMRRLKRNRRLKPKALRALQNKKLRALVKHSYSHVPYYHRLFKEAGLHPDAIKSVDDLPKIPITKKDDIRHLPSHELTANNMDVTTCTQSTTSGTTGIPLTVYREREYVKETTVRKLVTDLICGDSIWYSRAIFTQWVQEQPERLYQKLGIFPTKFISLFKDMDWQFEQLKAFNPQTIFTLPSHALTLAKEAMERDMQDLGVKLIFSNGELLDKHARIMVEDALCTEMFDRYGSAEVPRIYAECRDTPVTSRMTGI